MSLISQELGYINDADGYTFIRSTPSSQSEILGIVITGQKFQYTLEKKSVWWPVTFMAKKGYMHSSRIQSSKSIEAKILKSVDSQNVNQLLTWAHDYPEAFVSVLCSLCDEKQLDITSIFKQCNHTTSYLSTIFSKIKKASWTCPKSSEILTALQYNADEKGGLKLSPNAEPINIPKYHQPLSDETMDKHLFVTSIEGKPIQYYLQHADINPYAVMMFQGQYYPTDDSITFTILDSTLLSQEDTRPFYKHLLNFIVSKADGALAEAMGGFCIEYAQKYPCDFITFKNHPTYSRYYEEWLDFISFEYYFSEDPIADIKKNFTSIQSSINKNCPDVSSRVSEIEKTVIWRTNQMILNNK
jgi:uncharacterized protein YgiM (DUF1202 family)